MSNERQKAKEVLDVVFSQYIRLRDADNYGYCTCVTCGKRAFWTSMQNGHFIGRKDSSTRWNEINCNVQCSDCNCNEHGNIKEYEQYLSLKYGEAMPQMLRVMSNKIEKFSLSDIKEITKDYKLKVKILRKEKGL